MMTILIILTFILLAPFALRAARIEEFSLYEYQSHMGNTWDVYIFKIDSFALISFGVTFHSPYFHIGNVDLIG